MPTCADCFLYAAKNEKKGSAPSTVPLRQTAKSTLPFPHLPAKDVTNETVHS